MQLISGWLQIVLGDFRWFYPVSGGAVLHVSKSGCDDKDSQKFCGALFLLWSLNEAFQPSSLITGDSLSLVTPWLTPRKKFWIF